MLWEKKKQWTRVTRQILHPKGQLEVNQSKWKKNKSSFLPFLGCLVFNLYNHPLASPCIETAEQATIKIKTWQSILATTVKQFKTSRIYTKNSLSYVHGESHVPLTRHFLSYSPIILWQILQFSTKWMVLILDVETMQLLLWEDTEYSENNTAFKRDKARDVFLKWSLVWRQK